jgi:hypothetical protein
MSDELDVLRTVAQRLEGAGIAYMLSGSVAMSFYARPRMTRDIDLVVELSPGDAPRLAALFADAFYLDEQTIREETERRGMFNLIHSTLILKVDFVVRKDDPYRIEEFRRRRRARVGDFEVSIAAPEDLILSKLVWAKDSRSETQLGDVRNLLASVPRLDDAYLRRWAGESRRPRSPPGDALVTDTPPAVATLYHQLLMRRSGEERVRMTFDMLHAARVLARASLEATPDERPPGVRLFLRMYGPDFDDATRVRICAWLEARARTE